MLEGGESLCCRTMHARTELSENMIKTTSPKNFVVAIIAAFVFSVATPAWAADATAVKIANFTFGPQELKVKAGTTVTWTNEDDMPHTVVSPNNFRSKVLDAEGTYSFTFTTPGAYKYFCSLHPHMTGTIVVEAATGSITTQ
jgi:amicyanin